jgi:hypothetical protein
MGDLSIDAILLARMKGYGLYGPECSLAVATKKQVNAFRRKNLKNPCKTL